jgi:carbamoyl-phosphate synthase small subunit
MPHGVVVNLGDGELDREALIAQAKSFAGLEGLDLAKDVSSTQTYKWSEMPWAWNEGYATEGKPTFRVTVIDYGVKRNILRLLAGMGADITVVPANSTAEDVLKHKPHGVLLSNGPGDPAATGAYSIPTIQGVIKADVPVFGICLGHQMLGLALGAKTKKMAQGHHGANHPVKDLTTGKVEIVSMNHGFTVDRESLPRCSMTPIAAYGWMARTCSASSTTPKPHPARWIRTICSSALPKRRRSGPSAPAPQHPATSPAPPEFPAAGDCCRCR